MREQITKLFELGEVEDLFEVYAGCERPGLAGIDCWNWHVPQTGFFHLIFGNEKAWILPVTLKFQIFRKQQNIDEKRFQLGLQPIPEEYLGNEV
uniref:Acetyltransferase n=1 Tax=Meloidogyne hapla TaxID=6305 RepID=A0A1I8BRH8_MELHA